MEEKEVSRILNAAEADLKKAWDLLEEMSVRGYQARYRITLAQECILTVFERVKALKKAKANTDGQASGEGVLAAEDAEK